jgi:hypothetical protein
MIGLTNYLQHVTPAPVVVFGVELEADPNDGSARDWIRGYIVDGPLRNWRVSACVDRRSHYVLVTPPSYDISAGTHGTSYADCEAKIRDVVIPRLIAEAALLPELARRVAVEEAAQ